MSERAERTAEVQRTTKETTIRVALNLDGVGEAQVGHVAVR